MPTKKKKQTSSSKEDVIKLAAEELLSKIGVEGSTEVRRDEENDAYIVQIETEQAGILIGHRGETLSAFQLILKQVIFSEITDEGGFNLVVNVGDWRDKREETLKGIALGAVSKVRNTGIPQHIFELSPSERRFVHLLLEQEEGIVTESEGEGRDRHLVVKQK